MFAGPSPSKSFLYLLIPRASTCLTSYSGLRLNSQVTKLLCKLSQVFIFLILRRRGCGYFMMQFIPYQVVTDDIMLRL